MRHISYTYRAAINAKSLLGILAIVFLSPSLNFSYALAQGTTNITPTTGTSDVGTMITAHGHRVEITGGTRPDNGTKPGTNLFHSFDQFNVGSGDTAQFLNTTPSLPTHNILSRVTGENPSSIFGTIDTMSYPGANLFLMNPAGIVFGPNATLDVSGSVAFTTADYLRLANADGSNAGLFHADRTATSILTSASVAAFGFLGSNPAAIALQGSSLEVQRPAQSISLVGGNKGFSSAHVSVPDGVTVTNGKLSASRGRINIVSVASPGEIITGSLEPTPNIKGQVSGALGTVEISRESSIDTIGEGGGTILIRGGRLLVSSSAIVANTGDISLDATSIRIMDSAQIATGTTTSLNAGHITFQASGDITLDSASVISGSGDSSGHAGNITFSSSQGNLSLANSFVTSQAISSGGNTGTISMVALHGNIFLNDTFVFNSTLGTGTLGGILITGNNLRLNQSLIAGNNFSGKVAENITIMLEGRLTLTENSTIETATPGSADAADLIINSRDILITKGSALITSTVSSGDAGRLSISTDNLQLTDGGRLSSRSLVATGTEEIPSGRGGNISIEGFRNPGTSVTIDGPESGIFTSAQGTGPAGNIDVKATSVTLQNSGKMSAETTGTSSKATGGSITVNATDQVTLANGASITASSTGPADAGNISINAGQQLNMENSKVTTEANQSKAGNINIQAIDQVRVVNGEISTSVHSGAGKGGDITIDPKTVILQDGTKVFAQAVQGSGGNITITTPLYLIDPTSRVNADSQFGLNGSVTIQSPTSNLSGTVGQLASKTNPPQVLLQNRCVALAGGEQSTFILAGPDALPSQPGGWLSSPVAMEHWTGDKMEDHASGLMVRRVGPRESSEVLSLRQLTPPGFLVRSFAESALTGCRT